MKFICIGTTRINADHIDTYQPKSDDKNKTEIYLAGCDNPIVIDLPVHELDHIVNDAIDSKGDKLIFHLKQLTEALNRLTVHIPTSIRMHM